MPIFTGYTPVPVSTLPIVINPIDGTAASNVIMPTITLGGQVLNSPMTDVYGIAWIVYALDGWDSPDVRTTQTNRAGDDGQFVEPSYYGGRLLIAHGHIYASSVFPTAAASAQALMDARDRLFAAWNLTRGTLSPFIVNEARPKCCYVQRLQGCKAAPVNAVGFDFEGHFLAPDPRKYDPFPSTAVIPLNGTATVINQGIFESRPVITVAGPCTGVTLSNTTTGQTLSFNLTLVSTDRLVLDLDMKTALLNGNPATFSITSAPSQWWSLVSGGNVISFPGTGGAATATLSYRSSWM